MNIDPTRCPACPHPKHTGSDCEVYIQSTFQASGGAGISATRCSCKAADTRKASKGKTKGWDLLPWTTLAEEAEVYAYGAQKYEAHSWRKVDNALEEYTNAMFRHLAAHFDGQELDPESGLRHLAHARWNLGAVMELTRKK